MIGYDWLSFFFCRTRILQGQWLRDPHRRHCCDCSHTYKGRCSVAAHKLIIGHHVLSTWPWCVYLFISPQYGNNYLTFDIVSMVPYDRKLIDTSLLSMQQVMNRLEKYFLIFHFNFRVLYKCFTTLLLQQQNFEFTSSKIRSVSCFVRVFREGDVIYMTEKLYIYYFIFHIYTVNFTQQVRRWRSILGICRQSEEILRI